MKRFNITLLVSLVLVFTSCIKQLEKKFEGNTVAEIDAVPLNSNAAGLTYPILAYNLTQAGGVPTATGRDSTLRRLSGTVKVRINLVGPQMATEQTVGYKIFTSPVTSYSFPATLLFSSAAGTAGRQTPATAAGTLTILDAVSGTHYATLSGKATFPANSSFAFIDINVLNPGATAGQGRFLGIRLDSTGSIMPNPNYSTLGLVIDQR
jgi:hypothetical protein